MRKDQIETFEERFKILSETISRNHLHQTSEGTKTLSLLLALPQCIQRIEHAQDQIRRAHQDTLKALDILADLLGTLAERVPSEDFSEMKEALGDLNIQFTTLVGDLLKSGQTKE